MDENLEQLFEYVLKKQPCSPSAFNPSQISLIYEALKLQNFKMVRCIILNIVNYFRKDFVHHFSEEKKEFTSLFDLKVKSEGFEGKIFTFAEKSNAPFAVGKYSKSIENDNQTKKEMILGLLLNTIRDDTINFMYTYGGFTCTMEKERMQLLSLCQTPTNPLVSVAMFEYIEGEVFREFFPSLKIHEKLKVLLQITNALYVAFKKFHFKHNDLHGNNIIIKTLEKPMELYDTKFVPIIIDFGYASVQFIDQNGMEYNVDAKATSELSDIMSLIDTFPVDPFRKFMKKLCKQNDTFEELLFDLEILVKHPQKYATFFEDEERQNRKRKLEEEKEFEKYRRVNSDDILQGKFIEFNMKENGFELFIEFLQQPKLNVRKVFEFILEKLFGKNNENTNCKFRVDLNYYNYFSKLLELFPGIRQELSTEFEIHLSLSVENQIQFIFVKLLEKECKYKSREEVLEFLKFKNFKRIEI